MGIMDKFKLTTAARTNLKAAESCVRLAMMSTNYEEMKSHIAATNTMMSKAMELMRPVSIAPSTDKK